MLKFYNVGERIEWWAGSEPFEEWENEQQCKNIKSFSMEKVLGIQPSLQIAIAQLLPELQDVLLQSSQLLQLAGLEVAVDVLLVDLVDGQLAEVDLGTVEDLWAVELVQVEESIGSKFSFIDDVFIAFVEDVMQNSFGFDVQRNVLGPYFLCNFLVGLIIVAELGDDDKLLEGVVEVLLVVMEGRILSPLDFLLLPQKLILFNLHHLLTLAVIYSLKVRLAFSIDCYHFFFHQIQKLRDVFHGVALLDIVNAGAVPNICFDSLLLQRAGRIHKDACILHYVLNCFKIHVFVPF